MARRTHIQVPKLGRVLTRSGDDFVSLEALGGIALLAATVAALLWANFAASSYASMWGTDLTIGIGRLTISEDLQHWVNDGLMTVFFFVVGLEIKRELVRGELRDPRTAVLPVLAAIGGMVVPAVLFLTVNAGSAGSRGWAIPMATDIAFAVVILAILGSRIPKSLKLFLLTLAIVDDIGAIAVIALFYSEGIGILWLAAACGVVAAMLVMQRARVAQPMLYILPAVALWVCTLESGVHATLAGVVLGLLTPARPFGGREVMEHLEGALHPWSSLLVIPVFALANAGLNLELAAIEDAARSPVAWGIVVGLVVGKPLGIMAATGLGVLLRLGRLPRALAPRDLFGMSCVAGIGFTVSLFVADLSFQGVRLSEAKTGIFVASLLSAAAGVGWLLWASSTGTTRRSPSDAARRLDESVTAGEIHAVVRGIVEQEQKAIRWERVLLTALVLAATLETAAWVMTENWRWALGVAPLLVGAVVVFRTTRRRQHLVDEMAFDAELYVGPHSPWASRPPDDQR